MGGGGGGAGVYCCKMVATSEVVWGWYGNAVRVAIKIYISVQPVTVLNSLHLIRALKFLCYFASGTKKFDSEHQTLSWMLDRASVWGRDYM